MTAKRTVTRRTVVRGAAAIAGGAAASTALPSYLLAQQAPAVVADRIQVPYGVQSGDLMADQAVLWSRADRPARMLVDLSTTESFANARTVRGPAALAENDFTTKLFLNNLPRGQRLFYRVRYEGLVEGATSEPVIGSLKTAPAAHGDVRFVWSGDTAGQGYGINPDFGGMRIYETMRQVEPDFFVHSGDTIYADGPIEAERSLPDGSVWNNITIEEKLKVAETLQEFRGNFAYNLMDEHVRRFNAEVPMFAQWDDHETVNNWYPGEMLVSDDRYTVKSASLLAARGVQAFREYMPVRLLGASGERLYNNFDYGPSLEMFRIDMRSYRAANGANNQEEPGPDTEFLGPEQVRWLKQALLASKATWKVILSDMPVGMIVYDNWRAKDTFENLANGDGPVRGREFEIADLLGFMHRNGIHNVVWLTADVHYTAAHYYDPSKAQFQDFDPFWEFVSGPLNAGTFGPNDMDNTFGPQVMFSRHPEGGQVNLPPSAGMQYFGQVDLDGATEALTVSLKDIAGDTLYTQVLEPVRA